ncbi:Tetratricopeptide repeat-containing protein [Prosthecobacter debontii]|uniref:Tetratricopeptide repeat-containing protein n=1 Tax=Prosthecobacter debontii TaxID=48467 RepID=A0A1T4YSN5_9BACT|nr:tetratricopeptide repeat protein [Prosthecobacter debontii]SKB04877.1 Tetratricopeptide repeat-containing protein [Prosthecobacter debontii]
MKKSAFTLALFAMLSSSLSPAASLWDNPVFQKKLLGSFGYSSEVEPSMSETERADYEQILPLLKDDPDKALKYLEQLRALPNSSARFDFLIGNLHFQKDRKQEAAKEFIKALEKFPDYRQAHANLAILYAQSGAHQEAVRHFTEAIRLGAVDGTNYGLLGISYLSLENYTSAEESFRQAVVLSPDVKDWVMGLVRALYMQERFTDVIALLDTMLKKTPEDDSLWSLQANAYMGKKDMLAAAANFEVLDRMGKLETAQLSTLGDIYVNENMLDVAATAYLRAYEKDGGTNVTGPLRAAEILLAKEGYKASRDLLQKVQSGSSKLSPEDNRRVMKLEAKIGMAEGKEKEAVEILGKVAEQDPLDGETLLLLGGYYQRESNNEKAAFYYETAGGIEAFEADAKVRLAQLYTGMGKYADAIPLLKRAQDIKPRESVGKFLEELERFMKNRR